MRFIVGTYNLDSQKCIGIKDMQTGLIAHFFSVRWGSHRAVNNSRREMELANSPSACSWLSKTASNIEFTPLLIEKREKPYVHGM